MNCVWIMDGLLNVKSDYVRKGMCRLCAGIVGKRGQEVEGIFGKRVKFEKMSKDLEYC